MLVSPAEPRDFYQLGRVSSVTEEYGFDFLWVGPDGRLHGCQRKTIQDLIASVQDGRLAKEVAQMKSVTGYRFLIVEGRVEWAGGVLMGRYGKPWTRAAWIGLMASLQTAGIIVLESPSAHDTKEILRDTEKWTCKEDHVSLLTRNSPPANTWGTRSNVDFQRWLLQGLPGVGVATADAIIARFGCVPWEWTVTMDELMLVEGVGEMKARKMMEAFGGVGVNATSPDDLKRAVNAAMDSGKPTLINAVIDPAAGSESGRIGNLNPQSKLKKK